jgi:hypothetical protein
VSKRAILVACGVLASCLVVMAQGAAKGKGAPKAEAKKPVFMPAGDLKWADTPGAPSGVKGVTLWGDPAKGPYGGFQKFPAGFLAPLHTHTSDLRAVVISGTLLVGPQGGPENRLPAGSYEFIPSTYQHTTRCDAASECVIFVEAKGKFDVKPVEKPANK